MSIHFYALNQSLLLTCHAVGFLRWLRWQLDSAGWQGGFHLGIHPASRADAQVFEYESEFRPCQPNWLPGGFPGEKASR